MSDSDAVAKARAHAQDGSGQLSLQAATALPAKAARMTVTQLNSMSPGMLSDPLVAKDRQLIVITVHGPIVGSTSPNDKPVVLNVYTEVYDAASGELMIQAGGLDLVK